MNTYKTITYKSKNGDVNCYVIDGQTFLSQKEIANLLNVNPSTVLRAIKRIGDDSQPIAKMQFVIGKRKANLFDVNGIKLIAGKLGILAMDDFQNWASNISPNFDDEQYKIVRYNQDNIEIDVRLSMRDEMMWLSQNQIAELYGTTQPNISMHNKKIIKESELDFDSVHKDFLYTASDNKTYFIDCFNLDMILAIGYRVKSKRAASFRKWATEILKDYARGRYKVSLNSEYVGWSEFVKLSQKVETIDDRLISIEENNQKKPKLIFGGEYFDAFAYLKDIIKSAKKRIAIIDCYADDRVLSLLTNCQKEVECEIVTSGKNKLSELGISSFEKQFGQIIVKITNKFHDRFIILDDINLFHLGTSLNSMGDKITLLNKIEDEIVVESLLKYISSLNVK